ncbi:MAG TPA: response regulator transcription factor [Dehalococcoidia bacterium]|nr:response regulator transcription factor [Dehalococcoidia bacterium]
MKQKTKVLIADDHALLRESMRSLIDSQDDMEVVGEACDGEEAVRLGSELKPDIAVMDIVMPRMNGIEASKEIKKSSPGTAILILTAYDDVQYVLGLLEAGAAGYLLKSSRGRDVIAAIRAVKAGESVLHPSIIAKLLRRAMGMPVEGEGLKRKESLTEREIEVLKLAANGMSNKEIAQDLSVTVRTVKAHLSNMFCKMNVASRTEAILKAMREGWLELDRTPPDNESE